LIIEKSLSISLRTPSARPSIATKIGFTSVSWSMSHLKPRPTPRRSKYALSRALGTFRRKVFAEYCRAIVHLLRDSKAPGCILL